MNKATKTIIIIIALVMSITIVYEFYTVTANPKNMHLAEQKNNINHAALNPATITIIVFKNDRLYCYTGNDLNHGKEFSFKTENSIREFLLQRKKEVNADDFAVVIKAASNASYKTTVDVLDEMKINNIKNYSMLEVSAAEERFINEL